MEFNATVCDGGWSRIDPEKQICSRQEGTDPCNRPCASLLCFQKTWQNVCTFLFDRLCERTKGGLVWCGLRSRVLTTMLWASAPTQRIANVRSKNIWPHPKKKRWSKFAQERQKQRHVCFYKALRTYPDILTLQITCIDNRKTLWRIWFQRNKAKSETILVGPGVGSNKGQA